MIKKLVYLRVIKNIICNMEAKVVKVGTSLGLVIPRFIALEGGFTHGTPINIEYKNEQMVVTRCKKLREGWADAFARYSMEGEDEMLLPDHLDAEAEELM